MHRLHLRYLKCVLSVRRTTPDVCVFGETGQIPLSYMQKFRILKYWLKLVNEFPVTKLCTVLYRQMYYDTETFGKVNWASKVKDLLNELGFGFAWIEQRIENKQRFLVMIRERLKDHYLTAWWAQVGMLSKCAVYDTFKKNFGRSDYLDSIVDWKLRIAFTRLICSSHNLAIETGRWHQTEREERKCSFGCNCVEDEYHFLLVCPIYIPFRERYFKRYFYVNPTWQKFETLMTKLPLATAKYAFHAFKYRNSLL